MHLRFRFFIVFATLLVALDVTSTCVFAQDKGKANLISSLRLAWERDILVNDAARTDADRTTPTEGGAGFVALETTKRQQILVGEWPGDANVVVVRDRDTGALLWRRDVETVRAGEQAEQIDLAFTDRERVYLRRWGRTRNEERNKEVGALDAYDGRTGKRLWSAPLHNPSGNAVAKTDGSGRVYLLGDDLALRSLDAATGRERWSRAVTTFRISALYIASVTDKRIYVSLGTNVVTVDKATGALGKQAQPSEYLRNDIAAADWTFVEIKAWLPKARLFLLEDATMPPAGGGETYAEVLNEDLGFVRWGGGVATPNGDGLLRVINVAQKNEPERYQVVAEDARTGRPLWHRPEPPTPFSEFPEPAWERVNIVLRAESASASARDKPRTLYGADPRTGKSLWSLALPPHSKWTTTDDLLLVWLRDKNKSFTRVRAYLLPGPPR